MEDMSTASRMLAPTGDPSAISQRQQPPSPIYTNSRPPPVPPPLPPLSSSELFLRKPPPLNHPREDLLSGREDYINTCVPLYQASFNGDWEAAKIILNKAPELVRYSITHNFDTALHIATAAQHTKFVEALVELMDAEDLELQNTHGNTALCLAASAGNVEMIRTMVLWNKRLPTIPGAQGMMPLYMAALAGNHDSVNYLYDDSDKMTGDFWVHRNRLWVLIKCIEADLFDIALKIVVDRPEVVPNVGVLLALAQKRHAFDDMKPNFFQRIVKSIGVKLGVTEAGREAMELVRLIWKIIMRMPKKFVDELLRGPNDTIIKNGKAVSVIKDGKRIYSCRILFVAVEMGNTNFVMELIRQYPELIWELNDNNQSIFHVAVSHRQERIYNLLYDIGSMKDMIIPLKDPEGNNMLHLVGKKAEKNLLQNVSGVAFQMQRELLWFKVNLFLLATVLGCLPYFFYESLCSFSMGVDVFACLPFQQSHLNMTHFKHVCMMKLHDTSMRPDFSMHWQIRDL